MADGWTSTVALRRALRSGGGGAAGRRREHRRGRRCPGRGSRTLAALDHRRWCRRPGSAPSTTACRAPRVATAATGTTTTRRPSPRASSPGPPARCPARPGCTSTSTARTGSCARTPGEPLPGDALAAGHRVRRHDVEPAGHGAACACGPSAPRPGRDCDTAHSLAFDGITATGANLLWQITEATGLLPRGRRQRHGQPQRRGRPWRRQPRPDRPERQHRRPATQPQARGRRHVLGVPRRSLPAALRHRDLPGDERRARRRLRRAPHRRQLARRRA